MDGEHRRRNIIELLIKSCEPLSGAELAGCLGVSRQIIVQDIALLRAVNKNILSTNKGYLLFSGYGQVSKCRRTIYVRHKDDGILEELCTIADCGGKVLDVTVTHDIYGQITVDLFINNKQDAEEFSKKILECKTKPLNELTNGYHYHTVEADSEEILNLIEEKLKEKKYLAAL